MLTRDTIPQELLADVKNYLNITWDDVSTDALVCGYIAAASAYLDGKIGGGPDYSKDGLHGEKAVEGTTDLYTKQEFDPWAAAFEAALDADGVIAWYLNSTQYEEETGFFHHEWIWQLPATVEGARA